jgi:hypothetical protein
MRGFILSLGALMACVPVLVHGHGAEVSEAGAGEESPWQEFSSASSPWRLPDGLYAWYEIGASSAIVILKPDGLHRVPVPAGAKLEDMVVGVTTDSEGAWVFSTVRHQEGALIPGLVRFDGKTSETYTDRDEICAKLARKGAGYRIGSPLNPWYPVFDDQGRSVSSHAGKMVKFYDGQKWHESLPVPENDLYRRHPFLRDGKVVVVGKQGTYEGELDSESKVWTWTKVAPVKYPWPERNEAAVVPRDAVPADGPLEPVTGVAMYHLDGWTVAFRNGQLVMHNGVEWVTVDTTGTRLKNSNALVRVGNDDHGHWFFGAGDLGNGFVSVLTIPRVNLVLGEAQLGKLTSIGTSVRPLVRIDPPMPNVVLSYQGNEGPWRKGEPDGSIRPGLYPRGMHRLTLRVTGLKQLVLSNTVTGEFVVDYDAEAVVGPLIKKLGADNHQEREDATAALIRFGPSVAPYLREAVNDSDPEVATRAQTIIKAVAHGP